MTLPDANRPLVGIAWMVASGLCFVAVTGVVRYLGTDLPAAQSAFLRFAWGVVLLLPALPGLAAQVPARAWPLVAARGAVHTVAVTLWFYAMARLPVAEVTAIGYLNPVLVTLGASVFFAERLALRRILAVLVAIGGALIVLRPGLRDLGPGHLAQVAAAFAFAGSYLIAKGLSARMGAGAVVATLWVAVTLGLAPLAAAVWVPMTLAQVLWLGVVAACGTAGHYCMARAFAAAPLAVTQPVTFLQLVWAAALGVLVFAEPPDPFVLLGGAVIIAAISYIAWREAVLHRRAVTPAPGAAEI